jgi:hypothetical protein
MLLPFPSLKIEATCSSEMSVSANKSTQCHKLDYIKTLHKCTLQAFAWTDWFLSYLRTLCHLGVENARSDRGLFRGTVWHLRAMAYFNQDAHLQAEIRIQDSENVKAC